MADSIVVGRTPNFIRAHCAARFWEALPVLEDIIHGGLELSDEAAKEMKAKKHTVVGNTLVATIDQRLAAIKLYAQTGVGFRSDHTSGDEVPRRGVVAMPPWDSEVHAVEVGPRAKLLPANGETPDGPDVAGNGA